MSDKNKEYEDEIKEESLDDAQTTSIPVPTAIPIIIFFFALGLVLGGFYLPLGNNGKCPEAKKGASKSAHAQNNGPIVRLKYNIPPHAPYVGKKTAPVTIMAFDDFQCPFCKKFFHVVEKVMKAYPNDVRFVFINFPLTRIHKSAQLAAEVGMEAMAQGKFAQMHALLFENQRKITRANVEKWAKQIGMDVEKLKKALDSGKYKKLISLQASTGRSIGVRGTPTILVNGRRFHMTRNEEQSVSSLKKMIQEELSIIKKKKYPAAKAYALLTRNGVRTLSALNKPVRNRNAKRNNRRKRPKRKMVDPNQVYKVVYDAKKDPYKGAKDAYVTIIEFSDYKCPFCRRAEKTMDQILEKFKGKVKLVYLQNPLPFHKHAKLASETALEVLAQKGMDAYWKFHAKLFEHSREINPDNLKKWAKEAGLDMAKYESAIKNKTHMPMIQRHQKLAATFGARGTPTFFVNGYVVRGARPFDSFKPIVERELKKAESAINAKKTDLAGYYGYIMQKALPAAKYIGGDNKPRKRRQRPRLDTSKVYKIWPLDKVPFWGDPNAQVVVALGMDIQCPWCKKVVPILSQLFEGNPADKFPGYKKGVKFVFLHFPLRFHKDSKLAHEAMQEVFEQKGPEVFYKYMKKLYDNQRQLQRPNLEKWAAELKVDMNKFKNALDKHTHAEFIQKTTALSRKIGVRGTPTVYINGKQVRGRAYQIYKRLIDQNLEAAKKYIAEHKIAPAKYYEEIMKTAVPQAIWIQPGQAAGKRPVKRIPFNIKKVAPNAMGNGPVKLKIQPKRIPLPNKKPAVAAMKSAK